MAAIVYTSAKNKLLDGTMDLTSGTVTAYLVSSGYTPSAGHSNISSVSAGARLDSAAVTGRSVSAGKLTASTTTFTNATSGTAVAIVITHGSNLVGYQDDLGNGSGNTSLVLDGSDVVLNWGADGVLKLV